MKVDSIENFDEMPEWYQKEMLRKAAKKIKELDEERKMLCEQAGKPFTPLKSWVKELIKEQGV